MTYQFRLQPALCLSRDLLVKFSGVDRDRRQSMTSRSQLLDRLLPAVESLQHFLRNIDSTSITQRPTVATELATAAN